MGVAPSGWETLELTDDRIAARWSIGLVRDPEGAIAIIGRAKDKKPLFSLVLDPANARSLLRHLTGLVQGDS